MLLALTLILVMVAQTPATVVLTLILATAVTTAKRLLLLLTPLSVWRIS